ncbi:helix-turn-helix domain-containing protein [Streptomyces sp. NPDC017949]|uniref:helix-turn-helix domain-containing protein n=1 Tax=Streptomyces sp. NPDC017949 TaxID=3365020 RepID=UPI003791D91B
MSQLDGTHAHATAARRLGGALRGLQQRSGMTLRDLERRVLISDSSLSRYFRGATVPPWAVVRDICKALDADPVEYRGLWEAADGGQNRPPPAPTAPTALLDPSDPPASSDSDSDSDSDSSDSSAPAGSPDGAGRGRTVPAPSPPPRDESGPAPAVADAAPPEVVPAPVALHVSVPRPGDAGRTPADRPVAAARMRWTAGGLLAGLAMGAALAFLLHPAAEPEATALVFRNKAGNSCLDDSIEGLRMWPCNGLHYQEWEFRPYDGGPGALRNRATGACLDNSGTAPRARSCDRSTHQGWTVVGRADGSVQVRNLAAGTCLTEGSGVLSVRTCDGSDPQRWT